MRDTCAGLGIEFDGWQDGAGRLILAKREDGLYAADTAAMSIPRQVGKTFLIGAIVFALCLIFPRLTVLWTAHRTRTADEVFEAMQGFATRKRVAPHVARVLLGSGKQAIKFRNGSRILFGARERGFGRGFAGVGVLVFDEAQILGEAALDDMVPATNTAPNPLILMVGTPPKPTDPGEVFAMLRQEAIDGGPGEVLYIELSADPDADPDDREQWHKANPSYPHRTSERAMLRMRKNLTAASFLREALGIWDEITRHSPVVGLTAWNSMAATGPADGVKPNALAVDMSHWGQLSVSACWLDGDYAHTEEVWAGVDTDEVVQWLAERAGRRIPIVIDSVSPAAQLGPPLRARGRRVIVTHAPDMAKACGQWHAKVRAGRFTHGEQEIPARAMQEARKRPIGTAGGWGWDQRDENAYISPTVSMTLAVFGALATTKTRTTEAPAGRGRRASAPRRSR